MHLVLKSMKYVDQPILQSNHEIENGHRTFEVEMRRRLNADAVVYWSHILCRDCNWEFPGPLSIEDEPAQMELCVWLERTHK